MYGKPIWEILLSMKEGYPGVDEIWKAYTFMPDPRHDSGLCAGKGYLTH